MLANLIASEGDSMRQIYSCDSREINLQGANASLAMHALHCTCVNIGTYVRCILEKYKNEL